MDKKYIRLHSANETVWDGSVAEHAGDETHDNAPMILFYDPRHPTRKRIVPSEDVEFITKKEYFEATLRGELFKN